MADRKLKVFQTRLGFYDTVVAGPSQTAALRAWGINQDLFAQGAAFRTDDAEAVEAARAYPETPLRRPVGTDDAFALHPSSLPRLPDAPESRAIRQRLPKAKPEPPPETPADRSTLDAAEAALRSLDDSRKREEAAFRQRKDELETAREAAQSAYADRRRRATASVVAASDAFRKAGGKD